MARAKMPMDGPEGVAAAYEERVRQLTETISKRERELAILFAISSRIHGEESAERILDIALEEILDHLNLSTAWVFLGDEHARKLHLAASRGVNPAYLEEIRQDGLSDCLCPEVFWSGHRMQVRNTTQCPRMPTIVAGLTEPVAHACVPMHFEGHRRGVLNVAGRPGELFSDAELHFLETVGHQVCIAIERAGHQQAETRRNREARALAAVTKAIGGSLDLPAVLKAVGDTAGQILGADQIYILLGSDPRALEVGHVSGTGKLPFNAGETVDLDSLGWLRTATAMAERRLVHSGEAHGVGTRDPASVEPGFWLAVPLEGSDAVRGALALARTAPQPWTDVEVDLAEAFAAQASLAIESARLYEGARRAYQDLKDAQERMLQAEKMALLGTFASGLAHEVRNPLNSMGLQLSLLERRLARGTGEQSRELNEVVGVIREEIRRLDNLVGDFLLLARTNRLQYRPASLKTLADDVTRLLRPEAKSVGVVLRRQHIGEPLPSVRVDGERMKQVVINLVRNAIEALRDAGREGNVSINTGLVQGRATIEVEDDGPGLPANVDVFQLFVTTKDKGTGLGLSIAQQIVLEHGGEIAATGRPGSGAKFTITLPVDPALQEGSKP